MTSASALAARLLRPSLLATLLSAAAVSLTWAAVTFNAHTPPTWDGTNWVATANVTLSGGDKTVCLEYDTPSDPLVTVFCGTNAVNGTYDFTCTIPGPDVANEPGAIAWQLVGYTGSGNCTGSRTAGPSGTFAPLGTGPLAVGLNGQAIQPPGQGMLAFGLLGLAAAALTFSRRARRPATV